MSAGATCFVVGVSSGKCVGVSGGGGGLFFLDFGERRLRPVAPVRDQPDLSSLAVHVGACAISLIAVIT